MHSIARASNYSNYHIQSLSATETCRWTPWLSDRAVFIYIFIYFARDFPRRRNCSVWSRRAFTNSRGSTQTAACRELSVYSQLKAASLHSLSRRTRVCWVDGFSGVRACNARRRMMQLSTWYLCNSITLIRFLKLWSFIQQQPFGSPQINRGGGSIGLAWKTLPALFGFTFPSTNKDSLRVHCLDSLMHGSVKNVSQERRGYSFSSVLNQET